MCFLWLNYEIYATICPLDYWLVSFLICVNYSVGLFISCLMFICLKFLLTVCETQYYVYSAGLWFICYTSQSFKCSWFSVFFGLMTFCPLVFKLYNQNPRIPILLNWVYWDCVGLFLCSLRTNSDINIFGAISRDEVENLFSLGYSSFHWFWEVNLNQQILKTTFHQYFTVATKGVGRKSRPSSPLQLGVSYLE